MATMVHTFIAAPDHPEELSIFEGDVVEVVDLHGQDGWALVKDPSGHQGLVPRSYLDVGGAVDVSSIPSISPRDFSPRYDATIARGGQAHHATYETHTYGATSQISFDEYGDQYDDDDDDDEALQPVSPVAQIPQPAIVVQQAVGAAGMGSGSGSGSVPSPGSPGPSSSARRILHAFQQEEEGELTVQVGDAVKVISEAGGWTKVARVADGKEGLVPTWAVASG
jgi:hypothetical protein